MTTQQVRDLSARREPARHGGGPTTTVLVGALCGLAWAASLRGFMAQIAGPESTVDWAGTFGWILVPGILAGALLGWAEHVRKLGGRRGWRATLGTDHLRARRLDRHPDLGADGDLLRGTPPRARHRALACVAVDYYSFLELLALACAIPHRPVTRSTQIELS